MPETSLVQTDAVFVESTEACDESLTCKASGCDNRLQGLCAADEGDVGTLKRIRALRCRRTHPAWRYRLSDPLLALSKETVRSTSLARQKCFYRSDLKVGYPNGISVVRLEDQR